MNTNRLMLRKGRRYDGEKCIAPVPGYPGAVSHYVVERGKPNFRKPLRFVVDNPETSHGHYEYV